MDVTGYGRTYGEALADAEAKIQAERDNKHVGQVGGGLFGLLVMAFVSLGWMLANAALRPIAGSVFIVLLVFVLSVIDWLTSTLFGGAGANALSILLLVVSKLAMIGLMSALALQARRGMLALEALEAQALCRCFERTQALGMVAHVALYAATLVGGYFYSGLLIRHTVDLITGDASFRAQFGTSNDLGAVFSGPAPGWTLVLSIAVALAAVAHRRFRHPFARHLTMLGRLLPEPAGQAA